MRSIKLLVADDHAVFRESLKTQFSIQKQIKVVAESADGINTLNKIRKYKPDIALIDIGLPKLDGIRVIQKIREEGLVCKAIVLSMYEDDKHFLESIQAGADGYLAKTVSFQEVLKAVKTVSSKGIYFPKSFTPKFVSSIRKAKLVGIHLTPRESEILELLSKGLTNKEVAQHLSTSEKTVKNQLNKLFEKLEVSNRTQAVAKAIEKGLLNIFTSTE